MHTVNTNVIDVFKSRVASVEEVLNCLLDIAAFHTTRHRNTMPNVYSTIAAPPLVIAVSLERLEVSIPISEMMAEEVLV